MDMDKLVALCRRRGFLFQSSEIYGGLNGFWDYGPLGVELKRNVKEAWWRDMVTGHDDLATLAGAPGSYEMVGLDCAIIMHPQVWKCSGHYDLFHDFMVDCRESKKRYRHDQVNGRWVEAKGKRIFVAVQSDGRILVVGPSTVFTTYIGRVLPALGEESVHLRSIGELVAGVTATHRDAPPIATIKGSEQMLPVLAELIWQTPPTAPDRLRVVYAGQVLRLEASDLVKARGRVRERARVSATRPNAARPIAATTTFCRWLRCTLCAGSSASGRRSWSSPWCR